MKPPNRDELVEPGEPTLDEKVILKHFLGKTHDEAKKMFHQGSPFADDFMWMAEPGLKYYLPAAISYLESEDSYRDWEFPNFLMCSLSFQVEESELSQETIGIIRQVADYIDKHRDKFDITTADLLDEYLQKINQS